MESAVDNLAPFWTVCESNIEDNCNMVRERVFFQDNGWSSVGCKHPTMPKSLKLSVELDVLRNDAKIDEGDLLVIAKEAPSGK